MARIFAYTKGAKLTRGVLEKLAKAGYIPVPVDSLDCIRVIEPVGDAENTVLFAAAIETIRGTDGFSDIKKQFANQILKRIPTDLKTERKTNGTESDKA